VSAERFTPVIRKLAAQHGVSLASVQGTGVGGRVCKRDVLAAAAYKSRTAPTTTKPSSPKAVTADNVRASSLYRNWPQ
jgi:pyruvate dehydrogenase E2 component (dihydrolipoamide acetyltransferase)